jgi:hypothetical protein
MLANNEQANENEILGNSEYEQYWIKKEKKYARRRALLISIGIIVATFLSSLLSILLLYKI